MNSVRVVSRPAGVETTTRRGMTLIELLVIAAIIAVLIALMLPAIQQVREAANRTKCHNNLKQLATACHHYAINHNGEFPAGCIPSQRKTPNNPAVYDYGHSWLVLIMPFLEQDALYQKLDLVGQYHTCTGLIYENPNVHGLDSNIHNGNLIRGTQNPIMFCPSSPLPKFGQLGLSPPGPEGVLMPTYTGNGGAVNHSSTVNRDSTANPHDAIGRVSFGGVLIMVRDPFGKSVRISDIRDGAGSTLMIGEQSDWCIDASGARRNCRSDFGHGWLMGPRSSEYRNWNTVSVRYPINAKSWNLTGVGSNYYGPNRPIQSAHMNGAYAAFADGAVRFLSQNLDLQILYNLSNRDDGGAVSY